MTPTELVDLIRQRHNVVGDNFWSDNEILGHVYDASQQLAREAFVIEAIDTQSTVIGTRNYSFPTRVIAIKRIEYNGQKLQKTSFREDDLVTGLNTDVLSSGTPSYYSLWNNTIYLRAIPDSVVTLKVYSFKEATPLTTSSVTLDIPTIFQADTAEYAISKMAAKEKNYDGAKYWQQEWDKKLLKAKEWQRKKLRTDANANAFGPNMLSDTFIGYV